MEQSTETKPDSAHQSAPTTLAVANCNVLNLALPNRQFYENQDTYTQNEYERKIAWLGERFHTLNSDILGVEEVWDLDALKAAVAASKLRYDVVIAPRAENSIKSADGKELSRLAGAQGTPAVGLITRLKMLSQESLHFPEGFKVQVPELGEYSKFERPPLLAELQTKQGQRIHVIVTHLKSKRPKFLQDPAGNHLEDWEDPKIETRAALRSLIMRGAEAVALRHTVIDLLRRSHEPLIVLGDFNDSTHSVTTQLVAATAEVAYDKSARDIALFDAYELQGENALKKNVAYSHIYQGMPEVLDQILVSEEFVPHAKFAIGDVRRVDYFNDHLHEGRDRTRSDHGFVRALLRFFNKD